MNLIKEIKAARAGVKVYKEHRYNEYLVKLYHLQEKPHISGRGAGVLIEYVPARYHTESEADALETADKMLKEASNTAPADPVRYNEWRKATIKRVEQTMLDRSKNAGIECEADYISGALAAMMAAADVLYNMDNEQQGAVINPFWMFGIMRGGLLEELEKKQQQPEAVR